MSKCSLAIKATLVCFIYINKFYPQATLLYRYFYYHCPCFAGVEAGAQRGSNNLPTTCHTVVRGGVQV